MKKVFGFGLLMAAVMMVAFASCKKDPKVESVTLSVKTQSIKVGEEFTLKATIKPADAKNKAVKWESDKTDVATVDNDGKVKGIAAGEATITVTTVDGNKKATCKVTVTESSVSAETDIFVAAYQGDLGVPGKHFYYIRLVGKGMLNSKGEIEKDGPIYNFLISSDAPQPDPNYAPKMGKYTMGEANQYDNGLLIKHDKLTSVGRVTEQVVVDRVPFVSGELTLAAGKITFIGKDANDVEYNLTATGSYTFTNALDEPFLDEPKQKTTLTEEWTTATLIGRDIKNSTLKSVTLRTSANANGYGIVVMFIADKNAAKLPEGQYNVAEISKKNPPVANTIVKSEGSVYDQKSDKYFLTASFLAKPGTEGYGAPFYFFHSGTATVTATEITFNITTHFGSTLNLKYTGSLDITAAPAGAPMKAFRAIR